jgi:hypothetical protein
MLAFEAAIEHVERFSCEQEKVHCSPADLRALHSPDCAAEAALNQPDQPYRNGPVSPNIHCACPATGRYPNRGHKERSGSLAYAPGLPAKHDEPYAPIGELGAARGADWARHEDLIGHPANERLELNELSATYSINPIDALVAAAAPDDTAFSEEPGS